MRQKLNYWVLLVLLVGTNAFLNAQVYTADFSTVGGFNHSTSNPPAAGPATFDGGNYTIGYTSTPSTDGSGNFFESDGTVLGSLDFGGAAYFETDPIDISLLSDFTISAVAATVGGSVFNGSNEYFQWSYIIDGGTPVTGPSIKADGSLNTPSWVNIPTAGGSSLVVRFDFDVNGSGDGFNVTSVEVSGTSASGTAVPASFAATSTSATQINLSATANASSNDVVVIYNTTNSFGTPTGTYTQNDPVTGGGTVWYVGAANSLPNHTGLNANTQYFYQAFSVDGTSYSAALSADATTLQNEASNHVSGFTATANGSFQIDLSWSDNDGAVAADNFLILAKTGAGTFASIADGSAVADDSDWSDNNFAINVAHGTESAAITGLSASTSYDFVIYPYTNSGANIDFLTSGTVPSATTTTTAIVAQGLPYTFNLSASDPFTNGWNEESVGGSETWSYIASTGAQMNAFNGGCQTNEDWLISPALDLSATTSELLSFTTSESFSGTDLEVLYSTDYLGTGDPNVANWTNITTITSGNAGTTSNNTGLNSLNNASVYVAFKYTFASGSCSQWTVSDFSVIEGSGSAESDIATVGITYASNIAYGTYSAANTLTNANAIKIAEFQIRDGGADNTDSDTRSTILTDLSFTIAGADNIAALAIFEGDGTSNSNISEQTTVSSSTAFSGLNLSAADEGTLNFSVYATFNSTVTDNDRIQLTISSASGDITGSLFAATDAGAATTSTSGAENQLLVSASQFAYAQQPSNVAVNVVMTPDVLVEAVDANGSRDLDYTGTVSLSTTGSFDGSATTSIAATAGLATFNNLIFSATGTITITANDGSFNLASNSFDVLAASAGLAVFVNEMSQGSGGSKEWMEIVVTQDGTDLRGWDIGDNDDGSYTEFVEFANHSDWSNLSAGTVIAIYNGGDVDGIIVPDSDFSDYQVTIASNNATYFTGSWGSFGNSDGDDLAAIRDNNNVIVHDMAVTHPSSTISGPGSNQVTFYTGNSSLNSALNTPSNWTTAASSTGTPGAPNGSANTTWIQGLRPATGATPNPSGVSITTFTANSFDIQWTKPTGTYQTDWDGVLVFVSDGPNGVDLSVIGEEASSYTANTIYGSGTQTTDAGANEDAFCVANQTTDLDGNITVTGLTTGTTYYVYAYGYKLNAGADDDFSSEISGGSQTPIVAPSAGDIVITEIMYNSSNAGSDDEWIEIYNASGSAIAMDGSWRLSYNGNNFDFGTFTLNAGSYYTIAVGSGGDGVFNTGNTFTPDTNTLGVLNTAVANSNNSNNLTNSSASIAILFDPSNANITIDEVTYDDAAPWPTAADGDGPSLTLENLASDNSLGANWRASFGDGGTPGAAAVTELIYESGAWNIAPNSSTAALNATVKTGETGSISADGAITNLTIEASGTLTISAGSSLTVSGDISNAANMIIESEATLLQTASVDNNSGAGSYAVTRSYTAPDHLRFSYWSSPVTNAQFETVFATTLAADRYRFDASTQAFSSMQTGTLSPGLGYIATPSVQTPATNTNFSDSRTFNGTVNNGDVSITVTNVNAGDFILLGNPYPSSLDFDLFSTAHTDITGSVYYWDASPTNNGQSDYANWNSSGANANANSNRNNPSKDVRAMQGFMVQVDPTSGISNGNVSFTFTNAMRQASGNSSNGFYKTETRERLWLSLNSDSAANNILIMLDDRASDAFDRNFDAPIFKANQFHSFYSELANYELSIQGLDYLEPNEEQIIPLGVDAWVNGVYTIAIDSLNNWDASNKIILIDSLLSQEVDLSASNYSFTVNNIGAIKGRFYLKTGINSSVNLDETSFDKFFTYQDAAGQLVIDDQAAQLGLSAMVLIDLSGKSVQSTDLDPSAKKHAVKLHNLSTGVYLLQLTDRKGQMHNQKIYLK